MDDRTALNRNFLELSSGGELDEITLRRPERFASSLGAFDGPWFLLIKILDPQHSLLARAGEHESYDKGLKEKT